LGSPWRLIKLTPKGVFFYVLICSDLQGSAADLGQVGKQSCSSTGFAIRLVSWQPSYEAGQVLEGVGVQGHNDHFPYPAGHLQQTDST